MTVTLDLRSCGPLTLEDVIEKQARAKDVGANPHRLKAIITLEQQRDIYAALQEFQNWHSPPIELPLRWNTIEFEARPDA